MSKKKEKNSTPQGTIAILIVYIIVIVALWGSSYLTLLSRGGN